MQILILGSKEEYTSLGYKNTAKKIIRIILDLVNYTSNNKVENSQQESKVKSISIV